MDIIAFPEYGITGFSCYPLRPGGRAVTPRRFQRHLLNALCHATNRRRSQMHPPCVALACSKDDGVASSPTDGHGRRRLADVQHGHRARCRRRVPRQVSQAEPVGRAQRGVPDDAPAAASFTTKLGITFGLITADLIYRFPVDALLAVACATVLPAAWSRSSRRCRCWAL